MKNKVILNKEQGNFMCISQIEAFLNFQVVSKPYYDISLDAFFIHLS